MKVWVIIGKDLQNSDETYMAGVFSDEDEAKAQMNYFSYNVKSEYYIEEREI